MRFVLPVGGLLLAAALAAVWYRICVPGIDVMDPRWVASHTTDERCAAYARVARTSGWQHDMSLDVGVCGADLVGVILDAPTARLDLGPGDMHLGSSLQRLTGQRIGINDFDGWRTWYAANRQRTQLEWFRDAFAASGLTVPPQLGEEDLYGLLGRIGGTHSEADPPRYCGYRLLEDQNAWTELVRHGPTRSLTPDECRGFRDALRWWFEPAGEGPTSTTPRFRRTPPIVFGLLALASSFLLGVRIRSTG